MSPAVLNGLRSRRAGVATCWEHLLRLEKPAGPLAEPDLLARLIPHSLHQIMEFADAYHGRPLTLRDSRSLKLPHCACGRNPFRAYYAAGEQAMLEAVILLHRELPSQDRAETDLAEAVRATRLAARADIESFCGLCVLKSEPAGVANGSKFARSQPVPFDAEYARATAALGPPDGPVRTRASIKSALAS